MSTTATIGVELMRRAFARVQKQCPDIEQRIRATIGVELMCRVFACVRSCYTLRPYTLCSPLQFMRHLAPLRRTEHMRSAVRKAR